MRWRVLEGIFKQLLEDMKMNTTELIELLKSVEFGPSGRPREISLSFNEEEMFFPDPEFNIRLTGDGFVGAELGLEITGRVYVDGLESRIIPKQELPVIPKLVAEWIEEAKQDELPLYIVIGRFINKGNRELEVWKSANKNVSEIVARAWLDGFTVAEEQKYLVSSRESIGFWFLAKNSLNEVGIGTNKDYYDRKGKNIKLTEQEIKGYDSRYWAFAVPVEELEE